MSDGEATTAYYSANGEGDSNEEKSVYRLTWNASLSALAGLSAAQYPANKDIPPTLDLDTLGNNSLYLRWRPSYHVLAPGGHMNDPCGPMYDSSRKEYHIFYQSFPQHTQFGNTSWSHAISTDGMVTWKDVTDWRNRSMVAISPSPYPYNDWIGDFSGGAQPYGLTGKQDGNLTLMFTGNTKIPDNWQLPYAPQSEQQNIATSSDGGKTWQKYAGNPVLSDAPGGWNVTGWRDPIFQPDPALDVILGQKEPHFYMTFGSGIRGHPTPFNITPGAGPRIPLYSAPASNLTNWTFLGALFEVPQNYSFGGDATKTGNFAYNFEMSGFFSLVEQPRHGGDGSTRWWVVNMGAEGIADRVHPIPHWSLYALGSVHRRANNASVEMDIAGAGLLDWGNAYALNQFYDPVGDRRIIWAWSDEDIGNYGVLAQGFQGSLGLPRETFVLKTHNVSAPAEGVTQGPDVWVQGADPARFAVTTIGQRPAADVVAGIQAGAAEKKVPAQMVAKEVAVAGLASDKFHLRASVAKCPVNGTVGFKVRASPNNEEYTTITYFAANHSVVLDRSHSSLIKNFTKTTYVGYHRPYTFTDETTQPLNFDIFVDGSLLEIFLNDRFAMTGRVYPSRVDAVGAKLFSTGGSASFANVSYWDTMKNVWPDRPLNASSPLLFDKYYQTHVTYSNKYVPEGTQLYQGY